MKFEPKTIKEELLTFEAKFAEAAKSNTPLLDRIMHYIIKRKGKQMRPMFVFLCAKLHAPINESTYRAASLVELLHTATLVHDDVVDESLERRGFFSINAIWKNKIAVLVGDYLLSKGLLLSTSNDDFKHLHILSDAVRKMSEGELLQLEKSRTMNIDEETYFEIIRNKTASLLASACSVGAFSTTNDLNIAQKMQEFGECLKCGEFMKTCGYSNGGQKRVSIDRIDSKKGHTKTAFKYFVCAVIVPRKVDFRRIYFN